jgi:hypothetical protein
LTKRFSGTGRDRRGETFRWFLEAESEVTMNLRAVCEGLNLDVRMVQAAALRLAQQTIARRHRYTAAGEFAMNLTFQQVSLAVVVVALIVLWAMLRGGGK